MLYEAWQAVKPIYEEAAGEPGIPWPEIYRNLDTRKEYKPHNEEENVFVRDDVPRYDLLKGGEGGGKSTAGVIKDLERLRRGMNGILISPDLEHFKKSVWPEFRAWCPWHRVIERHRYRQFHGWEPTRPFTLTFFSGVSSFFCLQCKYHAVRPEELEVCPRCGKRVFRLPFYSSLQCGGAKESEIESWEGPNVSFAHFDEARRHRTAAALKVLDGRARITGPNGEPPQIYFTTTPRKHWLFEYFGPLQNDDPHAAFKADSYVATVLTEENAANLEPGFAEKRRQSLTEAEARVLLEAEWEDVSDVEKFVNILWWDHCAEPLPGLTRSEPMVLALDANKGGQTSLADCFAVTGVTRHPARKGDVAVRYCGIWQPAAGALMDFAPVEAEVRRLCREFSVVEVAYDPYQLHDMATRLKKEGVANFREFGQGKDRLIADKQLLDLIMARRIAHDGNPLLRQHVDNANVKKSSSEGIRLVKRSESLKIDAAVALSMGCARALYLNLA